MERKNSKRQSSGIACMKEKLSDSSRMILKELGLYVIGNTALGSVCAPGTPEQPAGK